MWNYFNDFKFNGNCFTDKRLREPSNVHDAYLYFKDLKEMMGDVSGYKIIGKKYIKDYYLSNTFLLLKINDKIYYIPNFTFIESNDLLVMKEYISTGMIYEF